MVKKPIKANLIEKFSGNKLNKPIKAILLLIIVTISITALLFIITTSLSGNTTINTINNGTFGEKQVSINNITIIDNITAEHYEYNGTNYYLISGYLKNNNNYDAFNLKMKAIGFDSEGNVIAENDTVYLNPKVLSVSSDTFFGFTFMDNEKKIVRYELQLISVDAEA